MHLVTRLHFRSRDKDGGHTIRSAVVESPMLHANVTAVCFRERELLPIDVYIAGIGIFYLFGSCDLDLERMTFIYELNPYPIQTYRTCESEPLTTRLSKVIVCYAWSLPVT